MDLPIRIDIPADAVRETSLQLSQFASFSPEAALELLQPLAIFMAGMVVYSIFIFKMYRFIATRDIFSDTGKYQSFEDRLIYKEREGTFFAHVFNFIKYVLLFPIVVFVFFLFFLLLLAFMSKNLSIGEILLVSMAVVGSIRITAYYNEDLSKDIAKMLPFALLGLYLIDISYFSFSNSLDLMLGALGTQALWNLLMYYLFFIIMLEFCLRLFHIISKAWSRLPIEEGA